MSDEPSEEQRFRLRVAEEYGDGTVEPTDPRTAAVVDALDRTRADLAAAPAPPLPPHVLARIDRALAAERSPGAPADDHQTGGDDVDRDPGRQRPGDHVPGTDEPAAARRPGDRPAGRRPARLRVAAALVAAAGVLAVLGAVVVTQAVSGDAAPPPVADPSSVPVVHRADPVAALRLGLGGADAGVPADRAGCLAANGVRAGTVLLGVRRVDADGTPGVLFVLPGGVAGRFRLLVVGQDCAAGVPSTVSDGLVGR